MQIVGERTFLQRARHGGNNVAMCQQQECIQHECMLGSGNGRSEAVVLCCLAGLLTQPLHKQAFGAN
jgi:hypothetical protein